MYRFRATGKVILDEGWRAVFRRDTTKEESSSTRSDEERTLPDFTKGESGPHSPTLTAKETTPPKPFTEATLLRAMETAGRTVDNEELRDALKENGIGRPSTRAAIIQTLFRRGYIRRRNKSLEATPTGVELIGVIKEELLKSAELTGQWETNCDASNTTTIQPRNSSQNSNKWSANSLTRCCAIPMRAASPPRPRPNYPQNSQRNREQTPLPLLHLHRQRNLNAK